MYSVTAWRALALVGQGCTSISSLLMEPKKLSARALTLLYLSSYVLILFRAGAQRAHQGPGLAGEQAFEAADDLAFGLALGGAASDVGPGGCVVLHADDDGAVERGVGLPVAAAVEAVPVRYAGGCRDRGDAAQARPGRFGADPADVVAGDDEQFGGGVRADAEGGDELRDEAGGEFAEQLLVGLDLVVELLPAARDRAQRVLGGCGDAVDRSWTQAGVAADWAACIRMRVTSVHNDSLRYSPVRRGAGWSGLGDDP